MAHDLNLVRVLLAVAETGSASAAAARLRMSQPGISNALRRLRADCGDPLFVRTGHGLEPTPRAQRLVGVARTILDLYDRELLSQPGFAPADSREEFRFAMSDIGEMVFLPRLVEHLRRLAPAATVRSITLPHARLTRAMQDGEVDLAVGYFPDLKGSQFFQQKLFSHGFTCLMRARHPAASQPLTRRRFAELQHAVVQAEGRSQEVFEAFLQRQGLRRHVALLVPHFMSIPHVVAKSDLVVTVPLAVGTAFGARSDIKMVTPAFDLPRFDLRQHWHRRVHNDARTRWLRQQVALLFNDQTDEWRGL